MNPQARAIDFITVPVAIIMIITEIIICVTGGPGRTRARRPDS